MFGRFLDLNRPIDRELINAVQQENFNQCKITLEKGANIHTQKNQALAIAVAKQNLEIVKLLLSYRANVNARKNEIINTVVRCGNLEMLKLLIDKIKNNESIVLAARYNHEDMFKLFLLKKKYNQRSINCSLYWAAKKGYLNIVKLIIHIARNHLEALIIATISDHLEIVKLFSEEHNHQVILYYSCKYGSESVTKYILECGKTKINYNNLVDAVSGNHSKVIDLILSYEIFPEIHKLLKYALGLQHTDTIQILLKYGARIDKIVYMNEEILSVFLKYGYKMHLLDLNSYKAVRTLLNYHPDTFLRFSSELYQGLLKLKDPKIKKLISLYDLHPFYKDILHIENTVYYTQLELLMLQQS